MANKVAVIILCYSSSDKRFQQWKRSHLYLINRYSGDFWIGK